MQEVVEVRNQEDLAALWLHLLDDHGISPYSTHGNPILIHGAASAFGLCDRRFIFSPDFEGDIHNSGNRMPPRES